jgi:hypothetical protein
MGVDLHWIGTTISSGSSHNGFGKIVSFPSVPASFPPYGTLLETLVGQEYPFTEGGGELTINGNTYPNQIADVNKLANGTGGFFLDWGNAFNVAYRGTGVTITTASGSHSVTINGTSYTVGSYSTTYYHNGSGGYYELTDNSYSSYGTYITSQTGITSYTNIAGTDYINGSYDTVYYSDGAGSYYSSNENASYTSYGTFIFGFNNQNEVPSSSGNYFDNGTTTDYYHDGSGGYYSSSGGSYYSSGTFITNDSGTDYYWDGSGGFYS